ncbi:hypothetical protein ACFDAU_06285 [Sulfuriferula sp. GW1]|uniref:hypothetical protein n=1 Tax=Sulfuriferula sp. GW1 TaxID=3345111 RepID=UPI0039B02DB7
MTGIVHTDLRAERDRIVKALRDALMSSIDDDGYGYREGFFPSPRMAEAMGLPAVSINAGDAVRIVELLEETLEHVFEQGEAADDNYLHEHGRISEAEREYRDPHIKGSKSKAIAAARALGLRAKYPQYWDDLLKECERFQPENTTEKLALIEALATRESKSFAAMHQGLKRAITNRRKNDEEVAFTLPRWEQ